MLSPASRRCLAVLFPGQGSQHPAMLQPFKAKYPNLVADVMRCVNRAIGFDLQNIIEEREVFIKKIIFMFLMEQYVYRKF